jgi:hypothetical protein
MESNISLQITEIPEDRQQRIREQKRQRQKRYYERNVALIQERRRERYDPEKNSEYYQANRERIRRQHRERYLEQRKELNIQRLTNLLQYVSSDLKKVIQNMIEGVRALVVKDRDVLAMEKAVILTTTVGNNDASDSKVDE